MPPAEPSEGGRRVLTVYDGVDAVMLLAGFVSQLPPGVARTDMDTAAAIDHLNDRLVEDYDLIVVVPDAARDRLPRQTEALLTLAETRAPARILLLPLRNHLDIPPRDGLRILLGPPFDTLSSEELWRRPTAAGPTARPKPAGGWRGPLALLRPKSAPQAPHEPEPEEVPRESPLRIIAVQPLAGGCGATTLAANLACELAALHPARRIRLMDLDLQFGMAAGYLDIAEDPRIADAYGHLRAVDAEAFQACLHRIRAGLEVFPAPAEVLPVDALDKPGVEHLLTLARGQADLVVVDLPRVISDWTEAVYQQADLVLGTCALDVRGARGLRRLNALIGNTVLPPRKLVPVLSRAPKRPTRDWREGLRQLEKGLGRPFAEQLPDGGPEVATAGDTGLPLMEFCPQNPLRMAIKALARRLHSRIEVPQTTMETG